MSKRKITGKLSLFCGTMLIGLTAFGQSALHHVKDKPADSKPLFVHQPCVEARPFVSGDGHTLYFCRRNYINNTGGKEDFQDVWSADLKAQGIWDEPKKLAGPVNTPQTDAVFGVEESGREMIILNKSLLAENPLAVTELVDGQWMSPRPLEIENYINVNEHFDAHYSYKNDVLVMAIETDESKGDQDLYVSFRKENNQFTEPVNLGEAINTDRADFAPFLGADGRTLFFASYGQGTGPNSNIYFSRRLDDTWTNWSEPQLLGGGVNSENDEIYISVTDDFKEAFFESLDPKTGERKVKSAKLPIQLQQGSYGDLAAVEDEHEMSSQKSLQDVRNVN